MMFDLIPYIGVGPLRFGMTKDEVRALLPVHIPRMLSTSSVFMSSTERTGHVQPSSSAVPPNPHCPADSFLMSFDSVGHQEDPSQPPNGVFLFERGYHEQA